MLVGLQREKSVRSVVGTRDNSTCNDRMLLFIGSYTTRYFILILHRTCILGNTVIGTAIRTLKQKLDCIVVLLERIPLPLHPTLL